MSDPFRYEREPLEPPEPGPTSEGAAEQAAPPADVREMSFEVALAELERIVQDLERAQLDLEASIRAYERGTQLKRHCEAKLKEAQLRVERITIGADGGVTSGPLDVEGGR